MSETEKLLFELIMVAVGAKDRLSKHPNGTQWQELYQLAIKQSLVGFLFSGIEKLYKEDETMKPPTALFYSWIGNVTQIESQNRVLNQSTEIICRFFKDNGVRSCVLKGQGVAQLYPMPLRRQPGDIDLWVEGSRDGTIRFLNKQFLNIGKIVFHHVDSEIIQGVATEIHFMPGYLHNPLRHRRVQRFYKRCANEQFSNIDEILGFAYPTPRFNAVYILAHIFMHFLYEGVGLRQLIDYYYVLLSLTETERLIARKDIKSVGLSKFAGGVMFVLQSVCGMKDSMLICEANSKRGQLLLNEILYGGNFGKYNESLKKIEHMGLIHRNLIAFKRQIKFVRYYPSDVLFVPPFKIWHWCWRKFKGYI